MDPRLWFVRRSTDVFDPSRVYGANETLFSLKIHHGGRFTKKQSRRYVNGHINYVDMVDRDEFSVQELMSMVMELGYSSSESIYFHFMIPGQDLDFGLRALGNDADATNFLQYVSNNKILDIYTEHEFTTFNSYVSPGSRLVLKDFVEPEPGNPRLALRWHNDEANVGNEAHADNGSDADNEDDSDFNVDDVEVEEPEVDMQEFKAFVDMEIDEEPLENDSVHELEDELDLDDFDSLTDEDNDPPLKKSLKKLRKKKKRNKDLVVEPFFVGQKFLNRDEIKAIVKSHAIASRRQLVVTRNDNVRFRAVCVGISVTSQNEGGSQVLKESKVVGGSKNPTCPWILHISNPNKEGCWIVKTFNDEHTCLQTREVRLCTVSYLAKEVEKILRVNPTIPVKDLHNQINQQYQISVSKQKVCKARNMAVRKIEGDYVAQYGILRDYGEELIRANPGTTVTLDVERECNPSSDSRQFKRIYICLGPLKAGFKMSGRELLGLDGTFMKGPFPGQILTAVGIDANNGIYPVAYALVESETFSAWTWFLECLGYDLDLSSNSKFTFISDRQKGIIPAIAKVFPNAEHRYCLRHIHENMKSRWRGDLYKNLLWNCASSTTVQYFEKQMKEIASMDKALHEWLRAIPLKHWSRAHFTGRSTSDVLLNNLCEVFNRQLVGGRDKPIITCLEFIREYLMRRIVVIHKIIAKCNGPLTPGATKVFEKIKTDASNYTVIWCGNNKYQVTGSSLEQYVVNVVEKTCSCRGWELTAMPCRHAVAVNWNMKLNGMDVGPPETWVSEVYWLDTWKKVYANTIEPINGRDMWTPSACPTKLTPPKHHKQIGRPKKKRKKTLEELSQPVVRGKLSRIGSTVTCDICKQKGHNKRTCTGRPPSTCQT